MLLLLHYKMRDPKQNGENQKKISAMKRNSNMFRLTVS